MLHVHRHLFNVCCWWCVRPRVSVQMKNDEIKNESLALSLTGRDRRALALNLVT